MFLISGNWARIDLAAKLSAMDINCTLTWLTEKNMTRFECKIGGKMAHCMQSQSRFHFQTLSIINTKLFLLSERIWRAKASKSNRGEKKEWKRTRKINCIRPVKKCPIFGLCTSYKVILTLYILAPNPHENLAPLYEIAFSAKLWPIQGHGNQKTVKSHNFFSKFGSWRIKPDIPGVQVST